MIPGTPSPSRQLARRTCPAVGLAACLLLAGIAAAAEHAGDGGVRPLSVHLRATDATHALILASQGDAEGFAETSPDLFAAPIALADERDPQISRRWTRALPPVIAKLAAEPRARIVAVLERFCVKALAQTEDADSRAAGAVDYLPAPTAVAIVAQAADRAFDRSRFAEHLACAHLLGDGWSGPPGDEHGERRRIALLLSGRGAEIDPADALIPPGRPLPASSASGPRAISGLTVGWRTLPGWLFACDPWQRVLWQYRIEMDAEVVCGAGGALVRDRSGLRDIDEDGTARTLEPPPGDTRLLAVCGGAAWFANGSHAWRLMQVTRALQTLDLRTPPLGPPLVRGSRSLWLTSAELVLFDGDQLLHRLRHGLAAEATWRLGDDGAGAAILADDHRSWRLPAFAAQLADSDALGRAGLLVMAERPADALIALDAPALASPAGRRVAFLAHLELGPAHVAAHADQLLALADDDDQRLAVAYAVFRSAEAGSDQTDERTRRLARDLAALARAHPTAVIGWDPDAAHSFLDAWLGTPGRAGPAGMWAHTSHALDATALASALERWLAQPVRVDLRPGDPIVSADAIAAPDASAPSEDISRDPQSEVVHRRGEVRVTLTRGADSTQLACWGAHGAGLRWRARWDADATAPSRALSLIEGYAIVSEGASRLILVDVVTGERLMSADTRGVDALASQTVALSAWRMALLHPLDVNQELVLIEGAPTSSFARASARTSVVRIMLPSPARWLVPTPDGRALVRLADGSAVLHPGAQQARLPPGLDGETAPAATADGLVRNGRLYRWTRAPEPRPSR